MRSVSTVVLGAVICSFGAAACPRAAPGGTGEKPLDSKQIQTCRDAVTRFVEKAGASIGVGIGIEEARNLSEIKAEPNRFLGPLAWIGPFTVALDQDEVWGFSVLAQTPRLRCNRKDPLGETLGNNKLRKSVLEFLASIGSRPLIDTLVLVDESLKCRGHSYTYKMEWVQPAGSDGVAQFLANVEVQANPFSGEIVYYRKSVSRASQVPLITAERCRALVDAAKTDPREIVSWRLILYEEHLPDGGRRPFWAATYKLAETSNPAPHWGREQERDAFIDGLTGEVSFE